MITPHRLLKPFASASILAALALTGCSTLMGKKPHAERLDFGPTAANPPQGSIMVPPYTAGPEITPHLEAPLIANAQRKAKTSAEVLAEEQEKEGIFVRPGFVRSPYAPDAGLVSVDGYPAGLRVKDPYTGRVMRVPEAQASQDTGGGGQTDAQPLPPAPPSAGKLPIQDLQAPMPPQTPVRRTR